MEVNMDEQDVLSEQVSEVEPVLTGNETTTTTTESLPPQPSIEETLERVLSAKLDGKLENLSRQFQSRLDKAVNRVQRPTDTGRNPYDGLNLNNLDEDTRIQVEASIRDHELSQYRQRATQEQAQQQQDAYFEQLENSKIDELKDLGIDPNDERIDWAKDASDFISGRKRFSSSVNKIVKAREAELKASADNRFKELESNLRKELGLDKVDTSTGGGASDSDAKFIEEYNDGLRDTIADHKRAQQILRNI